MSNRPRFLVCARDPSDCGSVLPVIEEAGYEPDLTLRRDAYAGPPFDPARHAGLILLGDGKKSADNVKEYGPEMARVRAAFDAGRAVLGVCHGAQLIAAISGGRLHKWKDKSDAGLRNLALTADGEQDPVVRHLLGVRVAQYHDHTFDLPATAVDLARSANARRPHSDAFRIGRNVYGLQFHPEPTAAALVRDGWDPDGPAAEVAAAAELAGRASLRAWVEVALQ